MLVVVVEMEKARLNGRLRKGDFGAT